MDNSLCAYSILVGQDCFPDGPTEEVVFTFIFSQIATQALVIISARAAEAIFDRSGHNQICHHCLCGASTDIVCKAHVHAKHANSRGAWGHAPQKIFKNYTL